MRRELSGLALLLAAAACAPGGVRPTESRVRVDEALDLGRAWLGEPAAGAFAIAATGTGPVTVLRVSTSHPELKVTPAEGRVAGGTVLPVRVEWSARTAGPLQGLVEVETDVEGAARATVAVRGEARALPACDDGNPCTDDRFDRPTERCVRTYHARACDDGNACTADDRCHDGSCRGLAKKCDDDNACTLDLCDPAAGCVHPPDPAVCADDDPCTADVCDPDGGCTHPDAPDGTGCGPFSCAQAHLCVFGRCRELDVTGISNGLPCFDGDLCTESDTCQAGRCEPGPRVRRDPEIVASFETFGGAGSVPATDGFRFLFADPDALRVVVRDGDALRHTATLPLATSVPPVAWRTGRFWVAGGDRLALVDALDPVAPAIVRQDAVVPPPGPMDIRHLVRVEGGLVAAAVPAAPSAGERSYLVFVPVGAGDVPGSPVPLRTAGWIEDLDADGARVAWVDQGLARFALLEQAPGAAPRLAQEAELGEARRVAVSGPYLALAAGDTAQLFELSAPVAAVPLPCPMDGPPGAGTCRYLAPACGGPQFVEGAYLACDDDSDAGSRCPAGGRCETVPVVQAGAPCPDCDDCCCPGGPLPVCVLERAPHRLASLRLPGLQDVALEGTSLFTAEPAGIHCFRPDTVPVHDLDAARVLLDPLPATRLDLAPGHLLASGPLALPLARRTVAGLGEAIPAESARRLTGERHGDVVAAVDGERTEVVLGGRAVVARYDLLARRIVSWAVSETVSGPARPRILRGLTRDAAVDTEVNVPFASPPDGGTEAGPACTGTPLLLTDRNGIESELALCGLHQGTLDVGGGRLWGDTATVPEDPLGCIAEPNRTLRVWSLGPPFTPEPVFERAYGSRSDVLPWRVRASDRGPQAALLVQGWSAPGAGVEVWDGSSGAMLGSLTLPPADALRGWSRDGLALEGARMLVGRRGGVDLYDAGSTSVVPRAQLTLPGADPAGTARVPWMAGGRAWVAATAGAHAESAVEVLYEVGYDAAGALSVAGSVPTGTAATRVFDNGLVAVVTRPSGVAVVRPACR